MHFEILFSGHLDLKRNNTKELGWESRTGKPWCEDQSAAWYIQCTPGPVLGLKWGGHADGVEYFDLRTYTC